MEASGCIYDIQRYSVHDGPGIRTLVFFKGCRLSCPWCANPESQQSAPELGYRAARCARCGTCRSVCRREAIDLSRDYIVDSGRCARCGDCVRVCPQEALVLFGRRMSIREVLAAAARDRSFYRRSGGGITVSGGEPVDQPAFLAGLLKACREAGFHTAVETSGFAGREVIRDVSPFVDLFLFDVKHMDAEKHARLCGVSNQGILDNLRELVTRLKKDVQIRVPVIPGFNDDFQHYQALLQMVCELGKGGNIAGVHLMPYHGMGEPKYRMLNREYPLNNEAPPSADMLKEVLGLFASRRIAVSVGG